MYALRAYCEDKKNEINHGDIPYYMKCKVAFHSYKDSNETPHMIIGNKK